MTYMMMMMMMMMIHWAEAGRFLCVRINYDFPFLFYLVMVCINLTRYYNGTSKKKMGPVASDRD
jgi:hypothetical protein